MQTGESSEPQRTVEIEAYWGREMDERVRQIDAGEVELLDGEVVMREMRAIGR